MFSIYEKDFGQQKPNNRNNKRIKNLLFHCNPITKLKLAEREFTNSDFGLKKNRNRFPFTLTQIRTELISIIFRAEPNYIEGVHAEKFHQLSPQQICLLAIHVRIMSPIVTGNCPLAQPTFLATMPDIIRRLIYACLENVNYSCVICDVNRDRHGYCLSQQ